MLKLIIPLAFISLMLLSYSLLKIIFVKQSSISRLKRYINVEEAAEAARKEAKREARNSMNIVSKGIGNIKFLEGYKKKVQKKLTRAHLLLKAEEYITLSLMLFAFPAILIIMLKGISSLPMAIIFGAVLSFLPSIMVNIKTKKRIKDLNDQLGDAITMISNSLKAGYSFFQAMDTVAKEMTGPISEEFTTLQKEINLGLNTEKALENMTDRVKSDDLELIVTALLIQRQVGGNLAEVLDNISTTIRDRVKIKGEIKTATAQGRISGLVISLLPVAIGVVINMINPQHMSLLFKNPLGIMIIGVCAVMELIGIISINKIVKIDY
ncbi:MAG: secretion system protein [Clostridiales bacterium]|nr:secretion system protein [Clostridiales bacterium]